MGPRSLLRNLGQRCAAILFHQETQGPDQAPRQRSWKDCRFNSGKNLAKFATRDSFETNKSGSWENSEFNNDSAKNEQYWKHCLVWSACWACPQQEAPEKICVMIVFCNSPLKGYKKTLQEGDQNMSTSVSTLIPREEFKNNLILHTSFGPITFLKHTCSVYLCYLFMQSPGRSNVCLEKNVPTASLTALEPQLGITQLLLEAGEAMKDLGMSVEALPGRHLMICLIKMVHGHLSPPNNHRKTTRTWYLHLASRRVHDHETGDTLHLMFSRVVLVFIHLTGISCRSGPIAHG